MKSFIEEVKAGQFRMMYEAFIKAMNPIHLIYHADTSPKTMPERIVPIDTVLKKGIWITKS